MKVTDKRVDQHKGDVQWETLESIVKTHVPFYLCEIEVTKGAHEGSMYFYSTGRTNYYFDFKTPDGQEYHALLKKEHGSVTFVGFDRTVM